MKGFFRFLFCAVFSFLVSPLPAEIGDKVTYPSFSDGHFSGEKIIVDDLRGKVVFFEYWGVQCGPCRAVMPHLVKLLWECGDENLVIIASHVQSRDVERMKSFLKETNAYFSVYENKSIPGAPINCHLPCSVLIGADGRILGHEDPLFLRGKLVEAVTEAARGYPILCDVALDKYKGLEKVIVSRGKDIESRIAPLRVAAGDGDTEAGAVCEAYDAWLESEKKNIERLCAVNPLRAFCSIVLLKRAVPSVTEFDAQAEKIKKHPTYHHLMAVDKKIQGLKNRMKKGGKVSAKVSRVLRKNIAEIRAMEGVGVELACDRLDALVNIMEAELLSLKDEEGDKMDKKKNRKRGKRRREDDED